MIFYLLYHAFAWSYDMVAAVVSFGHWNEWGRTTQPFLTGSRLLELGPGPGHLQAALHGVGRSPVGLDESRQMLRLASGRLRRAGFRPQLARGLAQALPFAGHAFDGLVATFPSEYIFDPRTLAEAQRVLRPGGRLVVLAGVWPSGLGPLRWLARLAGEVGPDPATDIGKRIAAPFQQTGFNTRVQSVQARGGILILVLAQKPHPIPRGD